MSDDLDLDEQFDEALALARKSYVEFDDPVFAEEIRELLSDYDEITVNDLLDQIDLEKYRFITPNCCEAVQKWKTIYIATDITTETLGTDNEVLQPFWYAGFNKDVLATRFNIPKVTFCHFCGTKLPEIVPSGITKQIGEDDGDGYCAKCGERCMCCHCLPPQCAWKPEV